MQADHERRGRRTWRPSELDAGVARVKARQLAAHREILRPDVDQSSVALLLRSAVLRTDLRMDGGAVQQDEGDGCE